MGILRTHVLHGATGFWSKPTSGVAPKTRKRRRQRRKGLSCLPTNRPDPGRRPPQPGWVGRWSRWAARSEFCGEVIFPAEGPTQNRRLLPTVEVPATPGLILDVETFSTVDLKKVGLYCSGPSDDRSRRLPCVWFGG